VDRLDLFSVFGELFPKLTAGLLIVGFIFAPRLVNAEIVSVGKEEARRITTVLESAIPSDRRPHRADEHPRNPPAGDIHH
jgi:hypothetical protein